MAAAAGLRSRAGGGAARVAQRAALADRTTTAHPAVDRGRAGLDVCARSVSAPLRIWRAASPGLARGGGPRRTARLDGRSPSRPLADPSGELRGRRRGALDVDPGVPGPAGV